MMDRETYNLVAFVAAANANEGIAAKSPEDLYSLHRMIQEAQDLEAVFTLLGEEAAHVLRNYILVWAKPAIAPAPEPAPAEEEGPPTATGLMLSYIDGRLTDERARELLAALHWAVEEIDRVLPVWKQARDFQLANDSPSPE